MEKKLIRRSTNHVAVGLIIYSIICYAMILIWMIVPMIKLALQNADDTTVDAILLQTEAQMINSGLPSLVGIAIGVLFCLLFFRKTVPLAQVFQCKQKMTCKHFFILLCVFMSGQFIATLLANGLEWILNFFGYTALEQADEAAATSTTISMLLYASFLGPIAEEFIYRGFVMRSAQNYGKFFAIVFSSVLFGVMHANLFQILAAPLVGIVLGYVALEYSIFWSILLHIINNFVFSDLLGTLLSKLSSLTQDVIYYCFSIGFFAASTFFLIKYRKKILAYLQENKTEKKCYRYAFTAIGMIVFLGANLALAFSGIQKLS